MKAKTFQIIFTNEKRPLLTSAVKKKKQKKTSGEEQEDMIEAFPWSSLWPR